MDAEVEEFLDHQQGTHVEGLAFEWYSERHGERLKEWDAVDSDFDLVWDTGVVLVLVRFDWEEERRWFFGTILPLRVCRGLRDGKIDTGSMSCLGLSLSVGAYAVPHFVGRRLDDVRGLIELISRQGLK